MRPKSETEINVENHLVKQIVALGGICEKVTTLGSRGFFDRLVVLPAGKIYFVELKKPKASRLSIQQRRRHARYRACGAEVVVLRSRAEVDSWLDGIVSTE